MILFVAVCLGGGFLSGIISGNFGDFDSFVRPEFYPPGWTFSVVWSILYILMGISAYLVYVSEKEEKKKTAMAVFGLQLILNFLWSPVFFIGSYYLAALILILIIFASVVLMVYLFFGIDSKAAYLQIPYVVWLCVATYLSYSVYVLN